MSFAQKKTLFGFLVMVSGREENGNNFSNKMGVAFHTRILALEGLLLMLQSLKD